MNLIYTSILQIAIGCEVVNMKKVIQGSVYNTETAKKICEQTVNETSHEKGVYVDQLKELYKTKSGKYFYFIKNEFSTYVDMNNDDLNPKFELQDVKEEKILPISYEQAVHFASEIIAVDFSSKETLGKFFPELTINKEGNTKIQKKIYISEKASWYLEMMMTEYNETNSSFIEKLITEKFRHLYNKEIMTRDPFV